MRENHWLRNYLLLTCILKNQVNMVKSVSFFCNDRKDSNDGNWKKRSHGNQPFRVFGLLRPVFGKHDPWHPRHNRPRLVFTRAITPTAPLHSFVHLCKQVGQRLSLNWTLMIFILSMLIHDKRDGRSSREWAKNYKKKTHCSKILPLPLSSTPTHLALQPTFPRHLPTISINLLECYHECRALIGYATHYLFKQ